jgi:hypothetical protein
MDLTVTPWKRYGHERSYVGRVGEPSLGYLDQKTGEVHVENEADRAAVLEALGLTPPEPQPILIPDPAPYAVTIERLASDLGDNRAGAGAKVKAQELRDAAPVRTFLAQPADGAVLVMRARATRKYLEGLPIRYAVHELDRLALWARRDTTWQP